MASVDISGDLAAVYYAAALLPDPLLATKPDPEELAAYVTKGRGLAASLLRPERRALVRCPCGTRLNHPDRPSRALATVHDRSLLVVQEDRGYIHDGLRLVTHLVVDFNLAARDGFHSAAVYCSGCGALHELGFRWLRRARRNEISTPSEHYEIAPWGDPIAPPGYTPKHPHDVDRLAFARITGPLDGPTLLVTLTWLYAVEYRNRFGFEPPHEDHLLRLIGDGDSRTKQLGLRELLTPQWRRWQLDPAQKELDGWDEPIPSEAIPELARVLSQEDADDREDLRLLFREVLDPDDFDTLQRLIAEEST